MLCLKDHSITRCKKTHKKKTPNVKSRNGPMQEAPKDKKQNDGLPHHNRDAMTSAPNIIQQLVH